MTQEEWVLRDDKKLKRVKWRKREGTKGRMKEAWVRVLPSIPAPFAFSSISLFSNQ